MKIALVHDYIKEYGGAERVLEALHEAYPTAEVFTTVYLPDYLGPHKERFADWKINTSFLQYIPFAAKLISPFRLLSPLAFKQFDFSGYDVIITSSTGAYFPNLVRKKGAKLICYCHTPPRYLYGYATARNWKKNPAVRILAGCANHFLRMVDFKAAQNVDRFIANSHEVAGRIKKFYRQDATVIYPPVEIDRVQRVSGKTKEYYVTGGRLARAKHVDLIVTACTEKSIPLKVFGKAFAGYGEALRRLAGPSIEFLGEAPDEEKWKLFADAKAFLFAAEDEDLGITPIEAMAAGIPVIAYRSGGVQETIVEGKTGLFFDALTVESLLQAIKQCEKTTFESSLCKKRAGEFSHPRFIKEITAFVAHIVPKQAKS